MNKIKESFCFCTILIFLFQIGLSIPAQGQQTISRSIPQAIARLGLKPVGRLDSTKHLNFAIGLPLRNKYALHNLLHQIYNPNSPNFHKYLTHEEFTKQFGPSEGAYQAVREFVKRNGLKVINTYSNRVVLDVTGRVTDIEKTFKIKMLTYNHPFEKRTFFAPDVAPSVPNGLPILDIEGLSNYAVSHPNYHKVSSFTSEGSGTNGSYQGYDFRHAYVPDDTLGGYGQTVGLFEEDGYYLNDIHSYEDNAGLPHVPMQNVLLDNFTGQPISESGNGEVSLDIEVAVAMAPHLNRIVVFEGNNWTDILNSMANHTEIHQFSSSWGFTGATSSTIHNIFEEMGTQGQSFFLASGDGDAFTGDLMGPDDDTLITTVGGTELTMNGQGSSYASETVWNSGSQNNPWWYTGKNYWGSGGGISTRTSIPSWQQCVDMSGNQGSMTMRNVPDVSMVADGVWAIWWNGLDEQAIMGTSIAAPLWASLTALVNERGEMDGIDPVGFINPALYSIGEGNVNAHGFHDITTGDNTWPDSPDKFYAEPGYDLCTGWGSPNGKNLIDYLLGYNAPALPTSITSNTTLSGKYYKATQNVIVDGSSTLSILSGVHLFFAPGTGMTVRPGSKITANDSSSQPIRFMRLDPSQAWGQVYLYGSGNQFTRCLFDGGHKNVEIGSQNNSTYNCTFRNGWRGISYTPNNDGSGGPGVFYLSNYMYVLGILSDTEKIQRSSLCPSVILCVRAVWFERLRQKFCNNSRFYISYKYETVRKKGTESMNKPKSSINLVIEQVWRVSLEKDGRNKQSSVNVALNSNASTRRSS